MGRMAGLGVALSLLLPAADAAVGQEKDMALAERDAAISACIGFNEYKPAHMLEAANDGMGDWIVWVEDTEGDLWLCDATGDGDVYANVYYRGRPLGRRR